MVSKTPGVTEIIQGRRWRRQRRGPRLSAESFGGWIEEAGEGSKPMGLREIERIGKSSQKPQELRDIILKSGWC